MTSIGKLPPGSIYSPSTFYRQFFIRVHLCSSVAKFLPGGETCPVMSAVFKTVCECARAYLGGFDSHTPPPKDLLIPAHRKPSKIPSKPIAFQVKLVEHNMKLNNFHFIPIPHQVIPIQYHLIRPQKTCDLSNRTCLLSNANRYASNFT